MVAEFESDLIRLRTREGMKVAKAKGRLRGEQPKLKPNQAKHLLELHDLGTYTQAELAELFGVPDPRSTGPSSGSDPNHQNRSGHSHISRILGRQPSLPAGPAPRASVEYNQPTPRPANTSTRHSMSVSCGTTTELGSQRRVVS
jgi:hypothetical protein